MIGPLPNARQEKFCQNIMVGMSQTDAYIDAGYEPKGAEANASHLTRNYKVASRIAELQTAAAAIVVQETGVTRARWIEELSRIAFSDVRRVVTWKANATGMHEDEETGEVRLAVTNQVQIVDADRLSAADAAAIASVEQTDKGGLKIRLHDKLKALDLIGRAEGFVGSDASSGVQVNIAFVGGPPDETREQWFERKALERKARLVERPGERPA